LLALLGCRNEQAKPVQPQSPHAVAPKPAPDPWQVAANADDPPDLGERNRIANEACPAVTGPYFFRIEKDGKVSHILGTRHIGVSLAKFPRPVHDAIASAKLAVFEVAPDDDSDLPDPKVFLPDELGPDLWKHYKTLVGEQTAQALQSESPSVAVLAMMVMYEDISATLDIEIERKVIEANIPTRGLESSEFQDRLLTKLLDIRMLRAAVSRTKDRKEIATESREDLAEYCAGTDDKPGMDEDMRADLLASGYTDAEVTRIDEEMVFARNADWIPKLEKILATNNVFIAVGADHLTGERGVVALLAKRGYKLTRITK
jgi:uncharacterized protein YbaP (TraB family)